MSGTRWLSSSFAPRETKRVVRINGVELVPGEYTPVTNGNPSDAVGRFDLVYAGHGIVAHETRTRRPGGSRREGQGRHRAVRRAVGRGIQLGVRGASLLMYVSPEFDSPRDAPASPEVTVRRDGETMPTSFLPDERGQAIDPFMSASLVLRPAAFDPVLAAAFGGTFAQLSEALADGKPTRPRAIAAAVEIEMQPKIVAGRVANVVAMLPGSDPRLKEGGVLVLFLSGEEKGLLGSGYDALHPLVLKADGVVTNRRAWRPAKMGTRSSGRLR